jgi:hypothetical protein
MATIVLAAAGTAIGGAIGGTATFLGLSAASIGGLIGSVAGSFVDSWLISGFTPDVTQRIDGPRMDSLRVTSATEGAVIPRVYGRARMGGNLIWATDFREEVTTETTTQGGGGKGGGGGSVTTETTTRKYFISLAVAICEGPIDGVGRVYANGDLLDLANIDHTIYLGTETQLADPFMQEKMGREVPAYRGVAYIVFPDLELTQFGNRMPQFSFEVLKTIDYPGTLEGSLQAVTVIPGSGEFVYSTTQIRRGSGNLEEWENVHTTSEKSDFEVSLDILNSSASSLKSITLVVSWFGDDLRAGQCQIEPGVELRNKNTSPQSWLVNGVSRLSAKLVSTDDQGRPNYGGTPSDQSVVEGIRAIKEMDKRITFYPFILMDVTETNNLPDPYSDNASSIGQPSFPWRGRITCSPATGFAGTVDKTTAASSQVDAFFGNAQISDFSIFGQGGSSPGGRTGLVSSLSSYTLTAGGSPNWIPGQLAGQTVTIYGDFYGDGSQFFGNILSVPQIRTITGNSENQLFVSERWNLGSAGSRYEIDFNPASAAVGVAYSGDPDDWGFRRMILHYAHLCLAAGGVDAFIIGTEMRGLTTIRSSQNTFPTVAKLKQLAADVRTILGPDVKISYAADWSEYFGYHPSDGSGDVYFHLDDFWSDSNVDFVGIDNYMPLSDWRDGFEHADAAEGWPAIYDRAYLQGNIAGGEGFDWFYASAADRTAQVRTPITDGAAAKPWVFRYKDLRAWWSNAHYDRPGGVESGTPTAWAPESKPVWFTELGCPAIDRGTNQPNVFFDPKSSESAVPYFSRGWRDDNIQRAYYEAVFSYWADAANNPISSVYNDKMLDLEECAAWTWDARPHPWFPQLSDVWVDGANWELGHWLTGRLGSISLSAMVRHICLRAGVSDSDIDVSSLYGSVEGYAIMALESPKASITTLANYFAFDAVESEGKVKFVMRGQQPIITLDTKDFVPTDKQEPFELMREMNTNIPTVIKWSLYQIDADYNSLQVESRRLSSISGSERVSLASIPMSVSPGEAEKQCNRALLEAWVSRETFTGELSASKVALDPTDVVLLNHDGRLMEYRLLEVADGLGRTLNAVYQDRQAYDMPPGGARSASVSSVALSAGISSQFLDLPQINANVPAVRPFVSVYSTPWLNANVYRSITGQSFDLFTTAQSRTVMGTTLEDLPAGPEGRFDHGSSVLISIDFGTLQSAPDLNLFAGANAFAVEVPNGEWEVLQAGQIDLEGTLQYRLSRLLRGQRGTGDFIPDVLPAGARTIALDSSLTSLPITESEINNVYQWRIGPANKPPDDELYQELWFQPKGVGLRPFSPCHVKQPYLTPFTPGDYTISWKRRDRSLTADSWAGLEVPMSEQTEAYAVEILINDTVVRTLTSNTTEAVYTEVDQITDLGSALQRGDTLNIRIAQLSATVTNGPFLTATLQF